MVKEKKIFNRAFVNIFIADVAMNLSKQMMNTLVTKYADTLGATATVVGLVASMFAVTSLLLKVLAGPAIDTFNRKWIVTGSMAVMAAAYVGYSLSTNVETLMLSRLFQGAGQAFAATCCLALATDALPADKLGVGIGCFSMAQVICQAIGPGAGLLLAEAIGYRNTFMAGTVMMIIAAVLASRISVPFLKTKKFRLSLNNIIAKEALLPSAVSFLTAIAYQAVTAFLVIYAGNMGIDSIGLFFTVYAIVLVFVRPMVGKLTDKYGTVKIIVPAMCCFAVSFYMISISNSLPMFLATAVVSALGNGAVLPVVQTLSMKSVTKERRGAASCTVYISGDLSALAGATVAGYLADMYGYVSMWRMMIIPVISSILLVIVARKKLTAIEMAFPAGE